MSKKHKAVVEPTPYATLKGLFQEMVNQFKTKGHWRPVSVDTDLTHGLAIFDSDSTPGLSVTVNWQDNQQWIVICFKDGGDYRCPLCRFDGILPETVRGIRKTFCDGYPNGFFTPFDHPKLNLLVAL